MAPQEKTIIAVVGAGAWGTALACVAARNTHEVVIWGRDASSCDEINRHHTLARYLPNVELPADVKATTDMAMALQYATIVLLVVPAQTTHDVTARLLKHVGRETPIVCCSKGIDRQTRNTPSRTVTDLKPGQPVAALSGPSFATDVARGLPTAVTLGSEYLDFSLQLAEQLSGPAFRIYASDDLAGVELGGALKNVIALAVGCCRGLELGASAEAAIIARGFREITEIATTLGAKSQTLHGLSGLGDLVLTCSNEMSRNFQYGIALGRGEDTNAMPLAEGVKTVGVVSEMVAELGLECVIVETINQVVTGQLKAKDAVGQLLARQLKPE